MRAQRYLPHRPACLPRSPRWSHAGRLPAQGAGLDSSLEVVRPEVTLGTRDSGLGTRDSGLGTRGSLSVMLVAQEDLQLQTSRQLQLVVDVVQVDLHRPDADCQSFGDLLIVQAKGDQAED